MHVDGSSNRHGSGARVILEGLNDITMHSRYTLASKPQLEYEALLAKLRLAKKVSAKGSSVEVIPKSPKKDKQNVLDPRPPTP